MNKSQLTKFSSLGRGTKSSKHTIAFVSYEAVARKYPSWGSYFTWETRWEWAGIVYSHFLFLKSHTLHVLSSLPVAKR